MTEIFCVYDCQVCGKKHGIKAKWEFQAETEKDVYHDIDFEKEVKTTIIAVAKKALQKLHPGAMFNGNRLLGA